MVYFTTSFPNCLETPEYFKADLTSDELEKLSNLSAKAIRLSTLEMSDISRKSL